MHANRGILKEASQVGAAGYILKNCTAADLVFAVKTVLGGGTYVSLQIQENWSPASTRDDLARTAATH